MSLTGFNLRRRRLEAVKKEAEKTEKQVSAPTVEVDITPTEQAVIEEEPQQVEVKTRKGRRPQK